MTRSHAKNNTTQSTLTYYERSLLRKDGLSKRLGGDSFKPLDACYLCLSKVTDPVACSQGHIYCRECVIGNLLTQKAGIEAQKREMERWEDNERREREDARGKARQRVVKDFEKGMGLGGVGGRAVMEDLTVKKGEGSGLTGQAQVEKVVREAEEKALRIIEAEQAEARKAKLAAFWLPSLTPEAKLGPLKEVKLQTLCHMGQEPHVISRKSLLPVILTYPPSTSKPICPSCSRELSNATSSVLLSSRSPAPADGDPNVTEALELGPRKKKQKKDKDEPYVCGHVVCKTCSETIVKAVGSCCVCEAGVSPEGRIPLGKEGTGFAAAGGVEVKKDTVAFRV